MAVAAYASLGSLSNLLDNIFYRIQIQYPPLDAKPFDALREGINFFLDFIEAHSQRKSKRLETLWWKIAEVAYEADDIIDAHVVDQLYKEPHNGVTLKGHFNFCNDMDRVNQKIEFIKTELVTAAISEEPGFGGEDIQEKDEEGEDTQREDVQALKHPKVCSSHKKDDIVVGLDDKVIKIMAELAGNNADLQIITITGMGGIGKTTLAKTVYHRPYIAEYFDVCLWVAVSQEYVLEKLIQGLLDSGEKKFFNDVGASEEHKERNESFSELSEKLYRGLFGRRYLVVMDDVWSTNVWDDLKRFFPKDGNGSRIMMTTRNSIVASSLSSTSNICRMGFLDRDSSWKLFCQKVFSQGVCPPSELEEVGRNIVEGCGGLPLSIIVIGSMLACSKMTREYWEFVAKDVNSFRNLRDDGHCLEIVCLSYINLPINLKACILYMRYFPVTNQIYVRRLFREWIAEGFIHPIKNRSLESVAEEYFWTLVNRNLILIHQHFANGDVWKCGVHDIVQDLCWREYRRENFIHSPRHQDITITGEEKPCFVCGKPCRDKEELNFPVLVIIPPSSSQVSPFICEGCAINYKHIKRLSLVKLMGNGGEYSCQELVHATKMQTIVVQILDDMKFICPSFVYLLWRLQNLTILASDSTTSIVLPPQIWMMPQLRRITVERAVLTYPTESAVEGKDFIVLKYLHTFGSIRNFMCTLEVVHRIPNLKDLTICQRDDSLVNNSLCNLVNLTKLESLELDKPIFTLENASFPNTLKRLFLRHTRIPWKHMAIIGSLPNLEWLVLDNACIGAEWNPTEGEFLRLKALLIESDELLYWRAENVHFPNLEKLCLRRIHHELEIPSSLGDIATLKEIRLYHCSNAVINSTKQIWEEQQENGNEMLGVRAVNTDGRCYKLEPFDALGEGMNFLLKIVAAHSQSNKEKKAETFVEARQMNL